MTSDFQQAALAVVDGDVNTLKTLLKNSPSLIHARSKDDSKATLLHYVAANGVVTEMQRTPPNAVEIARILLEAGADVDALGESYGGGTAQTPLSLLVSSYHPFSAGVQEDLVRLFCQHGAKVNGLDDDGTPIATAVIFGYTGAAMALYECGARADHLVVAAGMGKLDLVEPFFDNQNQLKPDAKTVGFGSNETGWTGLRAYVPDEPQQVLDDAFYYACICKQMDAARFLLDNGADVNARPMRNETVLHHMAWDNQQVWINFLIEAGADPNMRDERFCGTPAHWAMVAGNHTIKDQLIPLIDLTVADAAEFGLIDHLNDLLNQNPAHINGKDGDGLPLGSAAAEGHIEVVRLLLERGADASLKNSQGKTALDYAVEAGHEQIAVLLSTTRSEQS